MAPILLCRVAWMNRYQGIHGDKPHALAKFVKAKGFGAEVYNFQVLNGMVYGYPEIRGRMSLERLGAAPADELVSGITVVWCARSRKGGVYVVGWYKNATVYRDYDLVPMPSGRRRLPGEEDACAWRISASEQDVRLVEPDDRFFKIPGDFVNQTMVRYLDSSEQATRELRIQLRRLVAGELKPPRPKMVRGKNVDPQRNAIVEKIAIATATRHFEQKGYSVQSVEKENCGWDLTAVRGTQELQIEVKGRSSGEAVAELTANEYRHFLKRQPTYRLCIVTSALKRPKFCMVVYDEEARCWISSEQVKASVAESTAATVRL